MSVEIDLTRKAVQISWDSSLTSGDEVDIIMTNKDDGDISEVKGAKNTGVHVITYPADYSGSTQVTVFGSEGGSDEGTIEV